MHLKNNSKYGKDCCRNDMFNFGVFTLFCLHILFNSLIINFLIINIIDLRVSNGNFSF